MTSSTAPAVKTRGPKGAPKKPSPINVSDGTIEELTEIFKLLADKSRMKILLALAQDGEMHVTALCDLLGQSQPAVSHHLTLMRARRLVGYRRDGKHNYYRLESNQLGALLDQVFAECGNGHRMIQFEDFAISYKRGR